jgi:hypothetical protein
MDVIFMHQRPSFTGSCLLDSDYYIIMNLLDRTGSSLSNLTRIIHIDTAKNKQFVTEKKNQEC